MSKFVISKNKPHLIKRGLLSGFFYCVPDLIIALLSNLGVEQFDGLQFARGFPINIVLEPEASWNDPTFTLVLLLCYFLIGAILGSFIHRGWVLFILWIIFSVALFCLGLIMFSFTSWYL